MSTDKDPLGDRMKRQYENRSRFYLPRRTFTIIRLDGKAFHTYTRGLDRPYDTKLMGDFQGTAIFLCQNITGAVFAYTQSDEISILLTDFDNIATDAWYDNNVQKMASVSASLATGIFNQLRSDTNKLGFFDSRVFTIPDRTEVINYFVWRQKDCIRNSISIAAQKYFSQKELNGKNSAQIKEMLFHTHDIWWDDYPNKFKQGNLITKIQILNENNTFENHWTAVETPTFTQSDWLNTHIPEYI